jgi:hypothetical protein
MADGVPKKSSAEKAKSAAFRALFVAPSAIVHAPIGRTEPETPSSSV